MEMRRHARKEAARYNGSVSSLVARSLPPVQFFDLLERVQRIAVQSAGLLIKMQNRLAKHRHVGRNVLASRQFDHRFNDLVSGIAHEEYYSAAAPGGATNSARNSDLRRHVAAGDQFRQDFQEPLRLDRLHQVPAETRLAGRALVMFLTVAS